SLTNKQAIGYHLSYNYLSPAIEQAGDLQSKYVLASLQQQFIAGLSYQTKKFSIKIENRFLKRELGDTYAIVDIRMNYRLHSFVFYTTICNLLDAKYTEAGAVPMPSRWFELGIKFKWEKE